MKGYLYEYLETINDASMHADHGFIDPRMSDELKFRLLAFAAVEELLESTNTKEVLFELNNELKTIRDELNRIDPMESKETITKKMAAFLTSANNAVQFTEYPGCDEYEMKLLEAVHKLLDDVDKEELKKFLNSAIVAHDLSFYEQGGVK